MNALRNLALATALTLAVAGCSKHDSDTTPAGTSDPSAASSPHQQEATGAQDVPTVPPTGTPPAEGTDPNAASTPAQDQSTQPPPN